MKNLFALLLALVMVLSVSGLADESTWLTEEKVTLNAFVQLPANPHCIDELANNEFTKYYEDLTNVHINWVEVDYGAADSDNVTKLNVMLASNNYPDIILDSSFTKLSLYQAGLDKILVPLNDLIDEYAPNLCTLFEQRPDIKAQWTAPDGNIYGLGSPNEYYHGEAPNRVWVYDPWLEQLGIEAPQTVDEYYDFLVAVKNTDLNGNGIADEIPLLTMNNATKVWLMSAWTFFDGTNLMVEDDEVKFVSNTEAYRDAVRYIKRLYDEELIPADVFTMDDTQIKANMMNEDYKVATVAAFSFGAMFTNTKDDDCKGHDMTALAPLEGPTGLRQIPKGRFDFTPNMFSITSACQYPEIAIKWVDWMYNEMNSWRANYGPLLEGASEVEEGFYSPKEGLYWSNILNTENPLHNNNMAWGQHVAPYYSPITEANKTARMDGTFGWTEAKLAASSDIYDPYKKTDYVPSFFMSEEGSQVISEYKAVIDAIVEKNFAAFVTGTKDIENDWDAYLEELNNAGLAEYLDAYQTEYDTGVLHK